jgi:[acyl-carrier-protein] S-malonyltransferase
MKPAQERLKGDLDAATFHDLTVPLINNWQAKEVRTAAEAREGLYQQVPNPVRWTDTVRYLGSQDVTRFIEIGPGTVLAGLVRTVLPGVTCENISESKHLEPVP